MKTIVGALIAFLVASGVSAASPGGDQLFAENCSACHQPTGLGIRGAFPALKGSATVKGRADTLAMTVLNGRGGMPAFKDGLSDTMLAAILTYIRSSWGNNAAPISADVILKARGGALREPGKLLAH